MEKLLCNSLDTIVSQALDEMKETQGKTVSSCCGYFIKKVLWSMVLHQMMVSTIHNIAHPSACIG
jgi:hypothetical protein